MLVGILSFPVLVMRLSEAGLAARLRTPLASGHLGALVSLESVSLQSWPCVSCPGRLGSRGPCGERGSCSLALRWPWRASPASVGRGQAWLPSCSAPRVPLCRNPQKLPVCAPSLGILPWRDKGEDCLSSQVDGEIHGNSSRVYDHNHAACSGPGSSHTLKKDLRVNEWMEELLSGPHPPPPQATRLWGLGGCPPVVSGRCRLIPASATCQSLPASALCAGGWGFPRAGPSFHVFNRSLGQRRRSHTQPHCIFPPRVSDLGGQVGD